MSSFTITKYDLGVPYDLSTATFSVDGSTMFISDIDKEMAIRKKYPDVERLYEEYRVALILAGGEDL